MMTDRLALHSVETWLRTPSVDVAFVALDGLNLISRNRRSRITYRVTSGCGTFLTWMDGMKHVLKTDLGPGDSITIPAGRWYADSGNMLIMLATSEPPFDAADVDTLPFDDPAYSILNHLAADH